ncbi:MAG: 2-hydroxyacyl-CoA dehydratase family protein [Dehalococcoidia bacterium]
MKFVEDLGRRMKDRAGELRELSSGGTKVVGYFPGGYFPVELAYAAGAVPVALNRGGDHEAVEITGSYMSRWIYTFGRANFGYKLLGSEPVYENIDIYFIPITDNHVRMVADTWDVFTDVEVFRFGVPHTRHEWSVDYFRNGMEMLKARLEELTGNQVDDKKLNEAIEYSNRERWLFEELRDMRKAEPPVISARDFVALNHASLMLDRSEMVERLQKIVNELKEGGRPEPARPRLMLMGTTLAYGDYRILDMIDTAGGDVVVEEFGEGVRPYQQPVAINGNPMKALAETYFSTRVPPAWFRPNVERQELAVKLAREYAVDGVIWYQMMNRESDEFESYWYPEVFREGAGVPMLKLVSDYDSVERGSFQTRLETFMQMVRR